MESLNEPQDQPEGEIIDHTDAPVAGGSVFRKEDADGGDAQGPLPDADRSEEESGDSVAQTLHSVAATLEADTPAPSEEETSVLPRPPRTLAEVGLSQAFLTDLTLKIMHYSGTPSAAQLMRRLGLGPSMVQQIIAALQEERLCEVVSQSDLYTGNYRYRLSERGTARAAEALERTRYAGPVPVTVEQYGETIRAQQAQREAPSRERIKAVLDESVLAPEVADAIARALYSGKSALFHGPSGNGKTSFLERFARSRDGAAVVPYALYAYGQVIRVYDPSLHEPIGDIDEQNTRKDDGKLDRRWVLVRRPAVVLGSEIGPESLELAYDPQACFYQAPPHVKAQGGALVVDDLGRQKMEPQEMMIRWLISAERGWDSLGLITGEKLPIPFDVHLLFGTNHPLDQLGDDDLLRRILYKVEIPSPGPKEFAEMMRQICRQRNVQTPEGAIERVVEWLYSQWEEPPRASYARDLLEVIIEGAAYDERDPVLDEESFERALKLFMSQRDVGGAS